MELKTMRTIFKVTAIAGVPITGFLAARGGKTKAEKLLNGEPYETKAEKFVLNANSYGPAIVSGAVTITSIVLADYFSAKELAAAGALAAGIAANKNKVKEQFEKYRDVVKDEVGKEADVEFMKSAAQATYDGDGELEHVYEIDWLDKPIRFTSTHAKVIEGLNRINQELVDYTRSWGLATVTDALGFFGHKELATPETDKAGWQYDLLNVEWDCYWVDFPCFRRDEDGVYIISACVPPYENLQNALDKAHDDGTI